MKRFWDKVDKSGGPDSCWIWTASLNRSGYGQFRLDGRIRGAHQVAWELHNNDIPTYICHTCDNPTCVNPSHLYEGDPKSNMKDKYDRGRSNHHSKWPDSLVKQIRVDYSNGISSGEISEKYNIPKSTVCNIVAQKTRPGVISKESPNEFRYYGNRFKKSIPKKM